MNPLPEKRKATLLRLPLGLLLLLTAFATHSGPAKRFEPRPRVDAAVRQQMEEQEAVGVAVGLIKDNRIVYLRGYGLADREKGIPVDLDTMFRWASISKCLTAVAAMQLHETGKLDLEADVRTLVPEFPDKGAKITTRQLLSHLGGIVHYSNGMVIRTDADYSSPHPFEDVILALDTFKESPLVNPPGERFSYTTHGYILASAVIQRAGEQKFADRVRERIARPAGMTTLQPDYQWIHIPSRAVGYTRRGGEVVRDSDTDVSWKLGGGGFISNIEDLARFAGGLLDDTFLKRESRAMMWRGQTTDDGKPTNYALGFRVSGEGRNLKVYHSGSQEKTKTRMTLFPNTDSGIVVMCNSRHVKPELISAVLIPFVHSIADETSEGN